LLTSILGLTSSNGWFMVIMIYVMSGVG